MLPSSIKATFRHLWRNRLFTILNILGLTIGISACWVVYHIVDYELSYDKQHPDAERIYQMVGKFKRDGEESGFGGVPLPLAPALTEGITGLELVVPIYTRYFEKLILPAWGQSTEKVVEDPRVVATLPAYFDMVPHRWLVGDKQTALDAPNKVVLTESRAAEYFPGLQPGDLLGKTLYHDTVARSIAGVVADLDYPSSFEEKEFIAIAADQWSSDNWLGSNSADLVFIKVAEGGSVEQIVDFATNRRLEFVADFQREYGIESWFEALPLSEKHFAGAYATSSRSASMNALYGLMGIGFFLLILACINYINLSTAQVPQRAKEIGVRKTLGGTPRALIGSFLMETLAITVVAFLLAIPMTKLFTAAFPEFMPEGMGDFQNPFGSALFLLALLAAITLAAGSYPAWLITKVRTVQVLKGQGEKIVAGARLNFRKVLIVFQFVIAQVFVVSAIIIAQQLDYTLAKDLGFSHDAIVNVNIPYRSDQGSDIDPFIYKRALAQHPEIAGVALGHEPLNNNHWGTDLRYASDTGQVRVNMPRKYIDADYLSVYEMKLLAGANIQQTDTVRDLLINDVAREAFGFKTPEDAIGKLLTFENKQLPVVGVIADFHQKDLHVEIEPIMLVASSGRNLQTFHVKLPADRSQWNNVFTLMEQEWKAIYPNAPFECHFNDERIEALYESEHRMSKLIGLATAITIFISCLGLFGLATLTAFQRTKEIGVRKVLGASVSGIVAMLSKDFVKLVCVALLVASPIAWWAMNKWLEDFEYRINIEWWVFALAGFVAVVIALLTVSWQAVRAAVANPVDSLRDE